MHFCAHYPYIPYSNVARYSSRSPFLLMAPTYVHTYMYIHYNQFHSNVFMYDSNVSLPPLESKTQKGEVLKLKLE